MNKIDKEIKKNNKFYKVISDTYEKKIEAIKKSSKRTNYIIGGVSLIGGGLITKGLMILFKFFAIAV